MQLASLNTKRRDQLLVKRNCVSIPHGWAKRSVFNVFYTGGMWILSECYKFYHLCTTLIFDVHNVMMLKIVIPKKKIGITDEKFHLLMITLGHHWTLYWTEMENRIHFLADRCENYQLYQKIVQIKVVENWILYKKVNERICLPPPGVKLGGSKDWYV